MPQVCPALSLGALAASDARRPPAPRLNANPGPPCWAPCMGPCDGVTGVAHQPRRSASPVAPRHAGTGPPACPPPPGLPPPCLHLWAVAAGPGHGRTDVTVTSTPWTAVLSPISVLVPGLRTFTLAWGRSCF